MATRMNEHYPPILAEATADDILAVLRDSHRQQCTYDPEANSEISLSGHSTVAQWRDACDLLAWAKLAEAMNAYWSINVPLEDWRNVLEPAKSRQLCDVCELIARHAKLPRVRPATILGSHCVTAGAFLTVRSYLAAAGADVRSIAPSTPLTEYTRHYPGVFLGPVSQLAPGALPPVKIRTPVYRACVIGILVAWVGIIIGVVCRFPALDMLSALVFAICYAAIWIVARWVPPSSVEFRGLTTFGDLARALAGASHVTNRR